jgi:patatin-like phospholipase/acyl hydrolase
VNVAVDNTMRLAQTKPYHVLSIDGGGVRGIIPATILAEIEKRCQRPSCELFELIAGTSTGGIIATALVCPADDGKQPKFSAQFIATGYEKMATKIFYRSDEWIAKTLDGYTGPKYPTDGIDQISKEFFGDIKIGQALTDLAVVSYEKTEAIPYVFQKTQEVLMRDVIQATCAAPTYFSCKQLTLQSKLYSFVDGGMCANNPAEIAYGIAKKSFSSRNCGLFLSLGTGQYKVKIPVDKGTDWGALDWVFKGKIIDTLFDGPSEATSLGVKNTISDDSTYFRFQSEISDEHSRLDDTSRANLDYLKQKATAMIEEKDEDLRKICNKLEMQP